LPSLLPVGLGSHGGEFNNVYDDTFQRIVLKNEDVATVLNSEAATLQRIMTEPTRRAGHANDGRSHIAIGAQSLEAPNLPGQSGEVLVSIRAENIQPAASAPSDGMHALRAETLVVEPLGSHLLVTASLEGQTVKVVARTDFPANPGAPIWLRPEPDKLRWLRADDGTAIAN
jgi:ABC-type sugar transport system ATPase subunit